MGYPKIPASNLRVAIILLVVVACGSALRAQAPQPGILRGQVTDASGGSVEGATVLVTTPAGQTVARTTDMMGAFEILDLAPGNYNLAVTMAGFGPSEQAVQIAAGQVQQLAVSLAVAVQAQEVTVEEVAPTVDASASNNAGAVVMTGTDLEALSDDPDQLQADLQALAGPSAGPNGGQIFIDGFTGGQLPPKSSIREIRINSNPFSAEFDRMGFGRIEILTRPGTDTLHGRFNVQGNTSGFNTSSPYVAVANRVPYHSISYDGNLSGSLSSRASFTFSAFRRNVNNSSIVNAIDLDSNLNQVPFNAAVTNPQTRTNISPRLDYQISRDNTLTARYQYSRDTRKNQGVGGFSLPEQGYDTLGTEQSLQLSDTQILGERAVNETRFRFEGGRDEETAQNPAPTIRVNGAVTRGGSNRGSATNSKSYELQNYTSFIAGPHMLKFGGRLRANHNVDVSMDNFLGTFTFPSITAYQVTQQGLRTNCIQEAAVAGTSDRDCGPNQFTITAGTPQAVVSVLDVGLYLQDDWRLRPNLTFSGGLRLETQTKIPDHVDFAPRIGVAWAIGNQSRPTVIRGGLGMFYNRFGENNVLNLVRLNGLAQQQYTVVNPDFYSTAPVAPDYYSTLVAAGLLAGSQTSPTVYSLAPNYRSPYIIQSAVSVERQLTRVVNMSINFVNSRGVHQLITNNINAPLPGSTTSSDPDGVRPFGNSINMYRYESAGSFRQSQLINSVNVRAGARLSLFGYYVLNFAHNYTATNGFPTNPYNLFDDAGRANNDVRHRVNVGGTMSLPWALRLSPLVSMQSGSPYNFTLGQDLNLDSQFNDRPSFANAATLAENLVATPYGNFDKAPTAGQVLVPVNYGTGTSRVSVNMRVGKTFTFGGSAEARPAAGGGAGRGGGGFGGGGGAGRGGGGFGRGGFGGGAAGGTRGRYTLTFNVDARNIFNRVNRANPTGNVTSPLFGIPNGLAGGPYSTGAAVRRIDLSMAFGF
jgi:Carboxypeptidase regulatory-like domain